MKKILTAALLVIGQFFASAQEITEELEKGIYAHIYTNKGEIVATLDFKNVPMTVSNFVGLAEGTIDNAAFGLGRPFYSGSKWHRVVPDHVIQGGAPDVKGRGSTGYSYPNEIYDGLSHVKAGMLGIANAGPHTNGSQFYITLGDRSYLDGNYTLFGEVIEGMDVVNSIVQGDVIERIEIQRIGRRAERFIPTTRTFMKMVEKAKKEVEEAKIQRAALEDSHINRNFPNIKKEENEILHQTLVQGSGDTMEEGMKVKVRYSGHVLTDSLFFVSTEAGTPLNNPQPEVFEYTIGSTKINKGLDWLIPQMREGEKRIVILPAQMAYGRNGFYGPYKPANQRFVINPNVRILYEIEVLSPDN